MGEVYYAGDEMNDRSERNRLTIISRGGLGPENQGGFGPETDEEAIAVDYLAHQKYVLPTNHEFHCMDDRFFGRGIQLAGGRIWTEVAGFYMNPVANVQPLSKTVKQITQELAAHGNKVYDHGDEHHDEEGCAAKKFVQTVMVYNAQHRLFVAPLAVGVLREMNLNTEDTPRDVVQAINIGSRRARIKDIWDIDSKQATELIVSSGGEYEVMPGEHKVAGGRTSLSDDIFDNGSFFKEHGSGALSVTLGAYRKHLEEEGVRDIPKKIIHAALFAFGAKKILLKDNVQEVIVAA
jgi:hypothetical protein